MKKSILVAALCVAGLMAAPAVAQTGTGAAPAAAQDATAPDVGELLGGVAEIAKRLQGTVANLDSRIEESKTSAERGDALLTEMLTSARDLQQSLGRDSEIWTDLSALFDDWNKKRDDALKQSETKPQFKEIATLWQSKIDEAMKLREQILAQAAESEALVDAIEAQREIVLAYYEVNAADKVLESMRAMSEDLGAMNANMKSILDQTGVVAGDNVAQQ